MTLSLVRISWGGTSKETVLHGDQGGRGGEGLEGGQGVGEVWGGGMSRDCGSSGGGGGEVFYLRSTTSIVSMQGMMKKSPVGRGTFRSMAVEVVMAKSDVRMMSG